MILVYNIMKLVYYVTLGGGNVILRSTAALGAEMDEFDALLASTARDNNDNVTQNGNYHSVFPNECYVCMVSSLHYNETLPLPYIYYVT